MFLLGLNCWSRIGRSKNVVPRSLTPTSVQPIPSTATTIDDAIKLFCFLGHRSHAHYMTFIHWIYTSSQSFTYFLYFSYCRAVRSVSAGSISRPSVQKPPLFSPGPILSFEKCSLDPTDALHGPNLILSGCLYNFETNTFYQAQICIWYTQREKGFSELYLWLSGSRFYTIISNINFQHIDGNSGTYVWVQTAQSIEHANVLSENFYFWASGATFHS